MGESNVTYRNPPISEMSLVVQFASKRVFPPKAAIALRSEVEGELPGLDLRERLHRIGAQSEPEFITSDEIHPRWWFLSEDGSMLLQAQDDVVALNWRRLPHTNSLYPGFEPMLERFNRYVERWLDHSGPDQDRSVSVCSLMYDNIWPIGGASMGAVFSFWNTVGISGKQLGPEIRWTVGLSDAALGETGRIEVLAGAGGLMLGATATRAARLQLNGFAFPDHLTRVDDAIQTMHRHIHGMLERLTTVGAREAW
jgi:uncharacterized protein (TIGR04255 family)